MLRRERTVEITSNGRDSGQVSVSNGGNQGITCMARSSTLIKRKGIVGKNHEGKKLLCAMARLAPKLAEEASDHW